MEKKEKSKADEKLILHRFMSREEYLMYRLGEVLRSDTDHYRGGDGGSTSKGFCFFTGSVNEWAHRLNGLVSFDVLLTVELDLDNTDADVYISTGVYAVYPLSDPPKRKLFREVCTTAYSLKSMRFISADFSYSCNPRFMSKPRVIAKSLYYTQSKSQICQYPNI